MRRMDRLWIVPILVMWSSLIGTLESANISPGWKLLDEFSLDEDTQVQKFQSTRTNLTFLVSQAESPIVNGHICLATETFDDDGLPHTLEHLIFLGSEDYPYKELLDLLANRFFASRTNAFTDTDHTCYTVFTAGTSGFLHILPIYLDHILYPLLRDGDFVTEVHHINGDGEDAGVVYSEMQGVENLRNSLIFYPSLDALYPGNSSYEVRTGGRLKNLRESTSIESVRAYHKKFYVPGNLYITIAGSITPEEIMAALEPVEKKILKKIQDKKLSRGFERPFRRPIPPFTENQDLKVEFGSDDEKLGYVVMGWRLPGPINENIMELNGWEMISSFLTGNSASPLIEKFVEIAEPLATNVDYETFDYREPALVMEFTSVPVEKMHEIEGLFRKELQNIIDAGPNAFDITTMRTLTKRVLERRAIKLENGPHTIIYDPASLDQMYGERKEDLRLFLSKGDSTWGVYFNAKNSSFWLSLIQEMLDKPRLLVLGYPESSYKKDLDAKEKTRIAAQIKDLGTQGLKEAQQKLQNAVDQQKLPPESLLQTFPRGSVDSIKFRDLTFYNISSNDNPENFNISAVPFRVHLDDIKSEVVRVFFTMDFSVITNPEDRALVPLLYELWGQMPITLENGTYLELRDLVRHRTQTVIKMKNYFGNKGSTFHPGSQSELMIFFLETQPEKYAECIQLLQDTLFRVNFTSDRFVSVIQQVLNHIPARKASTSEILSAIMDNMYFKENTYIRHSSFLRLKNTAVQLLKEHEKNASKVMERFEYIRKRVLHQKNIFLYVATNLEKNLKNGHAPWVNFFGSEKSRPSAEFLATRFSTPSENTFVNKKPETRHAIASVSTSESCYMKQSIRYDNPDWEDEEVAALRVALKYLTDRMYNDIRGKGYTYGIAAALSVTEGKVSIKFSRSSLLPEGYNEFRRVLDKHLNASAWSDYLIESARGSQIYSSSGTEETVSSLISTSFSSILRGSWDPLFNRRFVQRVGRVTTEKVVESALRYLPRFKDPNQTYTAIVCNANDVDRVVETFEGYGFVIKVIEDLEDSFLAE